MRTRLLTKLAKLIYEKPFYVVACAVILLGLSGFITMKKLKISAGYYDMISDKKKYKRDYINFTKEFGDTEMIYIVIEAQNNKERAKAFADTLYKKLSAHTGDIKKIFYKVDYRLFGRNLLLFLDKENLKKLSGVIKKFSAGIKLTAGMKDLNDFFKVINHNLKYNLEKNLKGKVTRKGVEELKKWVELFRTMNSNVANKYIYSSIKNAKLKSNKYKQEYNILVKLINVFIKGFKNGGTNLSELEDITTSPEMKSLAKGLKRQGDGYLFTENEKLLLMMILPKKNLNELNSIKEPLEKMRKAVKETMALFPGIKAGVTGKVVLQADEMNTSNSDMAKASIISLFAVTLLFIIFFKNLPRPLLVTLTLIIAIGLTFGVVTVTVGHLTILSIVFTIILIGLGIDFGVHILSRYKAELQDSGDLRKAVETTLLSTGKANVTSAIAIASSFFAGLFTGFKGIQELGFIGGMGIILTFLSMIIVLPSLLCIYDRKKHKERQSKAFVLRFTCFKFFIKYPKSMFAAIILITLPLSYFVSKVHFNQNLTDLQAEGLESIEYEHKLLKNSKFSSWFGAFMVNDFNKISEYEKKLRKLSFVGEVHSILKVIPVNQTEKIAILKKIKRQLGAVKIASKSNKLDIGEVKKNISKMLEYFKISRELIRIMGERELADTKKQLNIIIGRLERFNKLISTHPDAKKILTQIQKEFFATFNDKMLLFINGLNPSGINASNLTTTLPQDLLERFVSKNGKYLIYAYSHYDLWQKDYMDRFVAQLRGIDSEVTGLAVLNAENRKNMLAGFKKAALFSLIIVFLIILADFRSLTDTLFALVPMIIGLLWLLIIMGIFKISFNFANFFAIPILIGIGIENGVQIMHRFKERADFAVAEKSTGTGVILTALTTIAGFGSLLIAKHKGVYSLGLIMSVGVLVCLLSAIIALPVLLKLFYPKSFKGNQVDEEK
jgi:hopanoid biosynthesis associated RND transporter like protein HpnN